MQMAKKRNGMLIVALLGLLTLGAGLPLAASGFPGGGGPGLGGPRPYGVGGVLDRLLFPCRSDCQDTANTCTDTADSAAVTCIEGACAADITAAQTACADDRRSQECRQRAAVTLCHYQGYRIAEAAEILGVSVEALESLLARARRTLRERLRAVAPDLLGED